MLIKAARSDLIFYIFRIFPRLEVAESSVRFHGRRRRPRRPDRGLKRKFVAVDRLIIVVVVDDAIKVVVRMKRAEFGQI